MVLVDGDMAFDIMSYYMMLIVCMLRERVCIGYIAVDPPSSAWVGPSLPVSAGAGSSTRHPFPLSA